MYLPGYEGEILPPEGSLDDDRNAKIFVNIC